MPAIKTHGDFHFRHILKDGRMLEVIFKDSNIVEQTMCCKFAKHLIDSLKDFHKFQNRKLVENLISDTMEKLKCKKQ